LVATRSFCHTWFSLSGCSGSRTIVGSRMGCHARRSSVVRHCVWCDVQVVVHAPFCCTSYANNAFSVQHLDDILALRPDCVWLQSGIRCGSSAALSHAQFICGSLLAQC
jgi:hypothetical protein